MNLPKLCFLDDFPIQNRRRYEIILNDVFEKLPPDVQQILLEKCEVFVLGYKQGITIIQMKKSNIILNALVMTIEDIELGLNLKRDYHILAHEFAHVFLNHKVSDEQSEKEADELAKIWDFDKP